MKSFSHGRNSIIKIIIIFQPFINIYILAKLIFYNFYNNYFKQN